MASLLSLPKLLLFFQLDLITEQRLRGGQVEYTEIGGRKREAEKEEGKKLPLFPLFVVLHIPPFKSNQITLVKSPSSSHAQVHY